MDGINSFHNLSNCPRNDDMEVMIKRKNIILDATTLTNIMNCGRLTDFRHNRLFQSNSGKSTSLEMGSIIHSYMENYYGTIINGIKREDAHGYGIAAAIAYSQSSEVTNCTPEDIDLCMSTIELYREHYKNEHWIPLEVEVVKQEVVYTDDEIRILWKAKLDLVTDTNQGIYPVDHKTMKQRRDSTSLNNQFIGQALLMKTRGVIVNKIGFQKSLKPAERFTRPIVPFTAARINEWQSVILPYWAYQYLSYDESGHWPPNYTHCENKFGFCPFKEVCEADPGMRESILGMNFIVGEAWDPQSSKV